jgi:catechol 2,3-dioxygenase-like lactoylglutathione lyase family enzyme
MSARSLVLGLDVLDYCVMRRMPQLYRNGELVIVIDCSDLARSARFWAGVLGFTAGRVTGGPYRSLVPQGGEGIEVLLQQVPDAPGRRLPETDHQPGAAGLLRGLP